MTARETFEIRIQGTYQTPERSHFRTVSVPSLTVDLKGIPGDRHYGHAARLRHGGKGAYPDGTWVRNRRQLSAVSVEELRIVAWRLGLDEIRPEWLGANLLFLGLPDLSHLPAGSRLLFPSGVGLVSEARNNPCVHPGEEMDRIADRQDLAERFPKEAFDLRGIVLTVERAGLLKAGDAVRLVLPAGPRWAGTS